jgi:hypothetical protein
MEVIALLWFIGWMFTVGVYLGTWVESDDDTAIFAIKVLVLPSLVALVFWPLALGFMSGIGDD